MGKKLLMVGLILLSLWMILYLPKVMYQSEAEPFISRHDCQIRRAECVINRDDIGQISLVIEPDTLPVMQPLTLTVRITHDDVDSVSLQFVGRDMDMGLQPVMLARNPHLPEVWQGEGTISLCTVNDDMVWMARLTVVAAGKIYISEFLLGSATHK